MPQQLQALRRAVVALAALAGLASVPASAETPRSACAAASATADLHRAVMSAEEAFVRLDESVFRTARDLATGALRCVSEPLTARDAAEFHWLLALGAFFDGDHAGTVSAFRAVLEVQPAFTLPPDLAPPGHPLRADFDAAAQSGPSRRRVLPQPAEGEIQVDGVRAGSAPEGRPWVYQLVDRRGSVVQTGFVAAGGAPPDYPVFIPSDPGSGGESLLGAVNLPLLATAGGAAVLGGVLYAIAAGKASEFADPATSRDDLASLRKQTNTMVVLSAVAGAGAAGAGAAAFVVSVRW